MLKPRVPTLKIGARPLTVERDRSWAFRKRRAAFLSEHPLCAECERTGRVAAAEELDHVVPLWNGGGDDESNWAGLCVPCHRAKTAREAAERG